MYLGNWNCISEKRGKILFLFKNLLRNEYFPTELPPCFHSESFADNHIKIQEYVKDKELTPSDPLTFSGYKNTNSRRKFAIPNPYHYAKAVYVIVGNSADIFTVLDKANASLTVPLKIVPDKNECYKRPTTKISESKEKIKKLYQNNLIEIRLDIQSFFDSVYTHAIAWAMHTKSIAKKNKKDKTLVGNLIDSCLQNLNSGQTNGILVGNAVSRIVSEIILCSVDNEIKSRVKGINYLRYVDDYFIFVRHSSQVNDILAIFRQELSRYELILNENKLQINDSPFIYGKPWVEQMRIFARLEPQLVLEKAIIEYHLYKDISILKYGLNVLRTVTFTNTEWKVLQPTIFNIWIRFPSLSNIVTVIFKNNENYISVSLLKKSIYAIFDTHMALKNDEEVIWAVWISKIFNIQLSQDYIKKILDTDNWLAIIILLDILSSRKSETSIKKLINRFRIRIIEEYFSGSNPQDGMHTDIWLLAYEADKNKWLNTSGTDTFLFARKHPFFKELRNLDISFYNNDYTYQKIGNLISNANIYVTRKELIELLKEYRALVEGEQETPNFEDVEDSLYEKIKITLSNTEEY